jgi:hypothetical protein
VFVMQGDDAAGVHTAARSSLRRARSRGSASTSRCAARSGRMLRMTSLSLWDPDDYFIEFNQQHECRIS